MQVVARIDRTIYSCVSKNITAVDVVLTDERVGHIKERHPGDFEKFSVYMQQLLEDPDYIIQVETPDTAFVLKEFPDEDSRFRLILKLQTSTEETSRQNSVITFQYVHRREYLRLIRNKAVLYKRPGL